MSRVLLERRPQSTTVWVADVLRDRIIEGVLKPGGRLREETTTKDLRVSRSTLREAFRLLAHERLIVSEFNRGIFVRVPTVEDVEDLYRVRLHLECSAVRTLTASPSNRDLIAATIEQGHQAVAAQDWTALGTANIRFHEELVAIAESPRLIDLMRGVLAELRLVFHIMDNPEWFHRPYLVRNQEILTTLEAGDGVTAAAQLETYLNDARQQLVEAYAAARPATDQMPS